MKKIIIPAIITCLCSHSSFSQLKISSGVNLITTGNVQVVVSDLNLINEGTIKAAGATFYFSGSASTNISSTGNLLTVGNITINKSARAQLLLNASLNIAGKVNFISGNIELNGKLIDLSNTGSFEGESEGSHITAVNGGLIKADAVLNAPNAVNIGNLGAIVTSPKNMGTVYITRKHQSAVIAAATGKSIKRSFEIVSTNAGANGTLTFRYLDAELNGINENNLTQFKSPDGVNYTDMNFSTRNATTNFVTNTSYANLPGIYTLSSLNSPPAINNTGNKFTPNAHIGEPAAFRIIPNPVVDIVKVFIASDAEKKGNIILYNVTGQQVMQQAIILATGTNQYQLNMAALANGAYTLVVVQTGVANQTARIIKQ